MTMDAMNVYLENRGFKVEREYKPTMKKYCFTLEKDGYRKSYYFIYPRSNDDKTERLAYMISDMEKCIELRNLERSCTTLTGNINDGYKYTPDNVDSLYPTVLSMSNLPDFKKLHDSIKADINATNILKRRINMIYGAPVDIKDVIFNEPATIVFWNDGTKTVVKAVNEPFDKEKGLAIAISKKYFGNKGNYYNHIKKWLD